MNVSLSHFSLMTFDRVQKKIDKNEESIHFWNSDTKSSLFEAKKYANVIQNEGVTGGYGLAMSAGKKYA